MDESSREVSGEGVPERDDVAALSVENRGSVTSDAELGALETASSLTGTTIGHYLVGERLGGGAMAAVYRAHDQILDRSVAIKVLLPGADSVMQARFRREARMVSGLVHPHIVRTLQVGRSGGIIYIAMELVEGASLGDVLERHGKLSVADAAHVLAPVAEALAYAHEKGIIHRDVKPSNILLQRANPGAADSVAISVLPYPVIPLLSDFGIARALDAPELTNAGRTIGTPAFMAPEQCAGSADIDGRADIYALGAVLYRCLVGRPPFAGSTTQILHAHVYDPLLIPDVVAESLPTPVVHLMARAMMKEPSQRFASVDLMAVELQSVADLPVLPVLDASTELVDPTMTMASLPVTQSTATGTSRILVPATVVVPGRPTPLKPGLRVAPPGTGTARVIPVAPLPRERSRSRRSQWGVMALGGAFVVLVILLAATLINSLLPGGDDDLQGMNATPTAAVIAGGATPQVVTPVPSLSPVASETRLTPGASNEAAGENSRPTPTPTPTGPTPTPTPLPLAVALPFAWKQAQAFYAEGDWEEAREWLQIVNRKLGERDTPAEAKLEISEQRVNEMLVASFVGLVTDAATKGLWTEALAFLEGALKVAPNDTVVVGLRDAVKELAELTDSTETTVDDQRKTLYDAIAVILTEYADRFERGSNVCDALFQVNNAINIVDSEELQDRKTALTASCETEKATEAIVETGGTILYSSQDGSYNIYRLEITADSLEAMQSSLVIQNGAQPRLSPNGSVLAYHNPVEGGLWAVTMGDGFVPAGGAQRYSSAVEDSRDGPPTWNASGTQVAFGRGSVPSHIFVTSADTNTDATDLRDGKDPAWNPRQDVLVFNGPDISGSNPGLYVMRLDQGGNDRSNLTQNGNDLRPTWTPDGKFIVFMSKDRGNLGDNWELYKYEYTPGSITHGSITRLTDGNPAQDGLPAISPDGKWVAFMSDRGGRWNLWYVSIDGGPVIFLSEIAGQPVAWLEHAVQWVR